MLKKYVKITCNRWSWPPWFHGGRLWPCGFLGKVYPYTLPTDWSVISKIKLISFICLLYLIYEKHRGSWIVSIRTSCRYCVIMKFCT
jgi:hypothetical protein